MCPPDWLSFARGWRGCVNLAPKSVCHTITLLAETLGRAGLIGEALASLSTGFAFASKNGEEWAVAELHRVQGDLLATEGKSEAARASFRRGVEAARRVGSLALERRLLILADGTLAATSTERS